MANEKEKTAGQKLEEELCYKSEAVLRNQPDLAEQALSLYDLTGWDALDGWLYLAGPADEGATLCLEDQVLDDNYDAHTRSVTTLELNWEEASDA